MKHIRVVGKLSSKQVSQLSTELEELTAKGSVGVLTGSREDLDQVQSGAVAFLKRSAALIITSTPIPTVTLTLTLTLIMTLILTLMQGRPAASTSQPSPRLSSPK